ARPEPPLLTAPAPDPTGDGAPDTVRFVVHRWTATELTRRTAPRGGESAGKGGAGAWTAAHQQAATYWQWRVTAWPQCRCADVHDLLEARHHYLAAGSLDAANKVSEQACTTLENRGAWDHATSIAFDMLRRLPDAHPRQTAWIHQLGNLSYRRRDYAEAERRYTLARTIFERLGDHAGMAGSYHNLGSLAYERGDYAEAERRYIQSRTIFERFGDHAGMAGSYHNLGVLAYERGDYAEAERRYIQSRTIFERFGDHAGMASSYHNLGALAYERGDYAEAERRSTLALTIAQRLADPP